MLPSDPPLLLSTRPSARTQAANRQSFVSLLPKLPSYALLHITKSSSQKHESPWGLHCSFAFLSWTLLTHHSTKTALARSPMAPSRPNSVVIPIFILGSCQQHSGGQSLHTWNIIILASRVFSTLVGPKSNLLNQETMSLTPRPLSFATLSSKPHTSSEP